MSTIDAIRLHKAVTNLTVNPLGQPNGGSPMIDNITVLSQAEYVRRSAAGDFAKVPTLMGTMDKEGDALTDITAEGVNRTMSDFVTNYSFNCPVAAEAP
jgi:hypothetical protein